MNIGSIIGQAAPMLGSLIGGPAGGMIGGLVGKLVGLIDGKGGDEGGSQGKQMPQIDLFKDSFQAANPMAAMAKLIGSGM